MGKNKLYEINKQWCLKCINNSTYFKVNKKYVKQWKVISQDCVTSHVTRHEFMCENTLKFISYQITQIVV